MALVVETGAGSPDAESFASVEAFRAYCDARGLSYGSAVDAAIEQALRRSTEYLDGLYRSRWAGWPAVPGQALGWPRAYVRDIGGARPWALLPPDTLPRALVRACCEAALRELQAPGSLTPDIYPGERVVTEIVGPLEVDYAAGGAPTDVLPVIVIVERIVAPLLRSTAGSLVMRA